ncbi:MAG: FISUMP domain-containing protein [Bacteroidales bacterium]|nr:FISUMP domain-containing protein [Bacteroidales bacterium]
MKKNILLLAMGLLLFSCGLQDNPDPGLPSVSIGIVTDITTITATCGGNVTADGGAAVTARGVCWSTSENPTISNSKTTDGTGLGTYTSNITGLSPNTTYYVRAYATNANSTAYSEQKSFTTSLYGSFTDSRDDKVYKTVTIGDQVWMAENLAYLPSVAGRTTGSETEPLYYVNGYNGTDVTEAKAYYHETSATYTYTTYGVLYNWQAAMNACPEGWHLPTDADWRQLATYLMNNGYKYDGTTGGSIRQRISKALASTTGWSSSGTMGAPGNTDYSEYINKSGFSALPGGYRGYLDDFGGVGVTGYFWSSEEFETTNAWSRSLRYDNSDVTKGGGSKENGFSVRCVQD